MGGSLCLCGLGALALGVAVYDRGAGREVLCLAGGAGRGALCACDWYEGRAACPPFGRAGFDGRVFCARSVFSCRGGFEVCELGGGEYVLVE